MSSDTRVIAVRCRTATPMSCRLISGSGEPVMRDPGRVLVANEFLAFFSQTSQSGTHTVLLPARRRGEIADRSTVWPLE